MFIRKLIDRKCLSLSEPGNSRRRFLKAGIGASALLVLPQGEVLGGQPGLSSKQRPKENEDHVYRPHAPLPNRYLNYANWHEGSCGRGSVKYGPPRKHA